MRMTYYNNKAKAIQAIMDRQTDILNKEIWIDIRQRIPAKKKTQSRKF